MRIKMLMLALAATLTATSSARATLSLQFGAGTQTFTTATGTAGTSTNPNTLTGLRNWSVPAQLAAIPTLTTGQQYILKIILKDSFTGLGTGTGGTGYTIPDDGSNTLFQFAMRLNYTPSLFATHDANASDGNAFTYTVNNGAGAVVTATNENVTYANNDFGANFQSLGNIMLNGLPNPGGGSDFRYTVANVVLTAGAPGTGNLFISLPNTSPPTFSMTDTPGAFDLDHEIWGPSLTNTFSIPYTVVAPEPSSLVLAGLAFSGIGYRLRRKKVAEVAA